MANMHKSEVASNYKVSNHIPNDLVFPVLSKLPLKSLKRFGSVCKSWSFLFENPNFMSIYSINFLSKNHVCYNDTSVLLHHKIDDSSYSDQKYALYYLSGDRFETRVKLDWPNPFQEDYDTGFKILGSYSINGILCLRHIFRYDLILWNPATKEFKVIPHSPIESNPNNWFENGIFGYDCIRDDYKVIRHAAIFPNPDGDLNGQSTGDRSYDSFWEIYSLRSNSWKNFDGDVPKCRGYDEKVFMDGVGHWISILETHNEECLVSFDFSNEIFFTTPIPSDIMDENFDFIRVWRHLLVLNGSIALIVNYTETTTFHLSILGEVGVKDSWTKILVVGLLPCIEYPIGAWKNGNMFIRKKDGELAWFDLSTHMIEELGIILVRFNTKIVIYKESFLPIRGISD